ncbi:MAG: hypothetical protein WC974_07620 [Thermoplasmata archaeon]
MVELFKELCKGPVVVVDDGIDGEPQIQELIKEIESNNLPVLKFKTITDARNKLRGILFSNFIIMDWKMDNTEGEKPLEIQIGATGEEIGEKEVVDFIKELQQICLAPIFVLSNFDADTIISRLKLEGIITDGKNCVFVENKQNLLDMGMLVTKIETWIKENPHVYLAKCWTNKWLSKNTKIFWDLFKLNPNWPVSFYQSFKKDGVDPILALRDTIFQLEFSEISLSSIDETLLNLDIGEDDVESLKKLYVRLVYICNNDDIKKEIRPGDIFKKDKSYYLNIRPECDTTTRVDPDPEIYLLKGDVKAHSDVRCESPYGILEKENQIVMLFLDGNDIVVFDKRKLSQGEYSKWKDYKICRVATPFITKIRQSYSSYLGRFGVPSYPIQIVDSIFKNKKTSS